MQRLDEALLPCWVPGAGVCRASQPANPRETHHTKAVVITSKSGCGPGLAWWPVVGCEVGSVYACRCFLSLGLFYCFAFFFAFFSPSSLVFAFDLTFSLFCLKPLPLLTPDSAPAYPRFCCPEPKCRVVPRRDWPGLQCQGLFRLPSAGASCSVEGCPIPLPCALCVLPFFAAWVLSWLSAAVVPPTGAFVERGG